MIFKNIKNSQVANIASEKLIEEYQADANWGVGTEADLPEEIVISPKEIQINELKQKLRDTDYQAIKFAEGRLTQEEYQSISNQRQQWRDKINQLEKEV